VRHALHVLAARTPSTVVKAERESVFRRDEIEQKYVSRSTITASYPYLARGRDRLKVAAYCHRQPIWEVDVYVALMLCEPDPARDEQPAMLRHTMHQFIVRSVIPRVMNRLRYCQMLHKLILGY
jgi:hypothetical protein